MEEKDFSWVLKTLLSANCKLPILETLFLSNNSILSRYLSTDDNRLAKLSPCKSLQEILRDSAQLQRNNQFIGYAVSSNKRFPLAISETLEISRSSKQPINFIQLAPPQSYFQLKEFTFSLHYTAKGYICSFTQSGRRFKNKLLFDTARDIVNVIIRTLEVSSARRVIQLEIDILEDNYKNVFLGRTLACKIIAEGELGKYTLNLPSDINKIKRKTSASLKRLATLKRERNLPTTEVLNQDTWRNRSSRVLLNHKSNMMLKDKQNYDKKDEKLAFLDKVDNSNRIPRNSSSYLPQKNEHKFSMNGKRKIRLKSEDSNSRINEDLNVAPMKIISPGFSDEEEENNEEENVQRSAKRHSRKQTVSKDFLELVFKTSIANKKKNSILVNESEEYKRISDLIHSKQQSEQQQTSVSVSNPVSMPHERKSSINKSCQLPEATGESNNLPSQNLKKCHKPSKSKKIVVRKRNECSIDRTRKVYVPVLSRNCYIHRAKFKPKRISM